MKKLRILLSVFALVLAVAGAWATSTNSEKSLVIQQVSNMTADPCEQVGTCDTSVSGESCKSSGTNNRFIKVSSLSCSTAVDQGRFAPNP